MTNCTHRLLLGLLAATLSLGCDRAPTESDGTIRYRLATINGAPPPALTETFFSFEGRIDTYLDAVSVSLEPDSLYVLTANHRDVGGAAGTRRYTTVDSAVWRIQNDTLYICHGCGKPNPSYIVTLGVLFEQGGYTTPLLHPFGTPGSYRFVRR
jgi:hypothetical protein